MTCITVAPVQTELKLDLTTSQSQPQIAVLETNVSVNSVVNDVTISYPQNQLVLNLYKTTEVVLAQSRTDMTFVIDASCRMVAATPLPDYSFYLVGEDLAPFTVVYQGEDDLLYALVPSIVDVRALQAKGILLNLVQTGDRGQVQLSGEVFNQDWSWEPEDPVYVGSEGQLTQVIPTENLFLRVGTALTSNSIFIDLEEPIIIEV